MAEGQNFLDNMKKSFADVPIDTANDNAIDTIAFLAASQELLNLIPAFGLALNKLIGKDIRGNIEGVREGCMRNPLHAATLQELYAVDKIVQEKLMWLMRGLSLIYYALAQDVDDETEKSKPLEKQQLTGAFRQSYAKVLEPHHSYLAQKGALLGINTTLPTSEKFYKALSSTKPIDVVREQLKPWLAGLGRIIDILDPLVEPTSPAYQARANAKK
ncbi:hypothetical protein SBRCBS47491_003249 [Sporothrix bragantina]|uniref:Glycolipid transfer protein domain-containing protein n=1 Tax=Sporothrix bragantina TaxID=671064 RepID=A0ABP0BDN5_9PEZI